MDKMHKGGCLCGKSRFEAYNEPDANIVCHCRYCQLRTGSPFGNILYFKKKDFKLLFGDLKTYIFQRQIGDLAFLIFQSMDTPKIFGFHYLFLFYNIL